MSLSLPIPLHSRKRLDQLCQSSWASARLIGQRWDWILVPAAAFILSRLVIFAAGLVGDLMLPTEAGHWVADPSSPFLSQWAKWDSQFYMRIAREGYSYSPGQMSNVAFFPLYPLMMRLVGQMLGGQVILAGFVVSNLSLLVTLMLLYRLTELEFADKPTAQRTVFYMAVFPTSFFLSAVYTESLFLMLSVGAIYFARRRWWWAAAVAGLLAAGTRNLGFVLWGLVMWEWLRQNGWTLSQTHRRATWRNLGGALRHNWPEILIVSAIPLGLMSFMLFLSRMFDNPYVFIDVQAEWGRQNIGFWNVLLRDISAFLTEEMNRSNLQRAMNVSSLLGALFLVPWIGRRLGAGYAIYVLIFLLVPANSGTQSMIRYTLSAFPVFMILGWWGRNALVDKVLISSFAIMLGVLTTVFVNWIFVA